MWAGLVIKKNLLDYSMELVIKHKREIQSQFFWLLLRQGFIGLGILQKNSLFPILEKSLSKNSSSWDEWKSFSSEPRQVQEFQLGAKSRRWYICWIRPLKLFKWILCRLIAFLVHALYFISNINEQWFLWLFLAICNWESFKVWHLWNCQTLKDEKLSKNCRFNGIL